MTFLVIALSLTVILELALQISQGRHYLSKGEITAQWITAIGFDGGTLSTYKKESPIRTSVSIGPTSSQSELLLSFELCWWSPSW